MLAVILRKRRLRLSVPAALLQVSNQTARGQHERDGQHANCLSVSLTFSHSLSFLVSLSMSLSLYLSLSFSKS